LLLTDSQNATVLAGLLTTTMAMVGDFEAGNYEDPLALVLFVVFLFLMIIVMFNVLIAIVSDRYNEVMETAEVEVRKLRALMIVQLQAMMSESDKRNPEHFPPYLEVLQAGSAEAPSEMGELRERMDKMDEKVDRVTALLEAQRDAAAADTADIMALLKRLAPRETVED